jgi:sensor histidine kinase YesM
MRLALREIGHAAGGSLAALALLLYLHREPMPVAALLIGCFAAVVARRALRPTYREVSRFLHGPLDAAVVLLSATILTLLTLAAPGTRFQSVEYWVLRWRESVALLGVAAFIELGVVAVVSTHRRMSREIAASRAREEKLREATLRAQLSALQAQINPHFLFNSLNALAELVHVDAGTAEQLVGDLAHLLRYGLRSSSTAMVPLAQELEAVDRYLRIERARFGDRLKVEVVTEPGARSALVPGLLLQPLVENAIGHAVAPRAGGGTVRVNVAAADGGVRVTVEDDGPGLPAEVRERLAGKVPAPDPGASQPDVGKGGHGGGLANVRQRVELAYRGAARLSVGDAPGGGARIELWVPQ